MIKLDMGEVEKALGYTVKRNTVSVGFDTATRTGIAQIKTNGKSLTIEWSFLEFESKDKHALYKNMYLAFKDILQAQDIAIIEDTFVGINPAGSLVLTRLGAFAIGLCIEKKIPWHLIRAVSARSILKIDARRLGKGKSKEAVALWLKEKLGLKLDDPDISDAIVLALLGVLEGIKYEKD